MIEFKPNKSQREAKARFWQEAGDNPLIDATALPAVRIAALSGSQQVGNWLRNPQFVDWFYNKNTAKQKLEAAAEVAIDKLMSILENQSVGPRGQVTAASQVNAAKLILEYAGMAPAKTKIVEFRDKEIAAMSEEQLRAYVAKHQQPRLVGGDE